MIWPIRMPPRMKALLYGLLSLGLVAAALAFVRTVYVKDLDSPDYSRQCSQIPAKLNALT